MKNLPIDYIEEYNHHFNTCRVVQAHDAWVYVDWIRRVLDTTGMPNDEFGNMLDVEFVALHINQLTQLEDNVEIMELYHAWTQALAIMESERETHTQCQDISPTTSLSFSRQ